MGDLVYAALVITIIWAGIFVYLVGQSRRLKRLEETVAGMKVQDTVSQEDRSVDTDRSGEQAEA